MAFLEPIIAALPAIAEAVGASGAAAGAGAAAAEGGAAALGSAAAGAGEASTLSKIGQIANLSSQFHSITGGGGGAGGGGAGGGGTRKVGQNLPFAGMLLQGQSADLTSPVDTSNPGYVQ